MAKNTFKNLILKALKEATQQQDQTSPKPKGCYRIDAGGCIKCPKKECNKKTTPCKYRTPDCEDPKPTNEQHSTLSPQLEICCDWCDTQTGGLPPTGCFDWMCHSEKACRGIKYDPDLHGRKPPKQIKEAEMTAGDSQTSFKIKVDVSNKQSETKLGIRIQLTPTEGMLEPDARDKVELAITKKLNTALGEFDIQVSKDTDVPDPAVIGFFIPLSQIKNMIVKSIGGSSPETKGETPPTDKPEAPAKPTAPAKPVTAPAEPEDKEVDEMINKEILREMRVRDLKEISQVVVKEDFYSFINAGNNVLRTLEENNIPNGKKYLEYLTKHNIM